MMSTREPALDEEGVEPLSDRIRDLPRTGDRAAGRRTLIGVGGIAALAFMVLLVTGALAAERFQRLKGREITGRFSGMEFTDDVHWAVVFGKGGRLSSFDMGRASTGTWRVEKDELCSNTGRGERCQEVWMSGNNVQLRKPGFDIYDEGVLRKPQERKLP